MSGVAIATALMPPLCTVGYGLSILNWSYVLGALYLFLINSIFISLATFVMVKYLKFPVSSSAQGTSTKLSGKAVAAILVIIIVPSVLSAVRMVQESNFRRNAATLVSDNKSLGKGFIYDYTVDVSSNPATIELYMAGERLAPSDKEKLYSDAEKFGITRSQIVFREEAVTVRTDISETEVIQSILEHSDKRVERLNATIEMLQDSIQVLNNRLNQLKPNDLPTENSK